MTWINFATKLFYPGCIWKIPKGKTVYITFDDGPNPNATPIVLDVLKKHKINATFFCVGENIVNHPSIFSNILENGHAVGNHTFSHENGWKTSINNYLKSVQETSLLMSNHLFRPPYGRFTRKQRKMLIQNNYKIIMWSWISQDYKMNRSNESILNSLRKVKSGDILVFHDNEKTAERIGSLIDETILYLKEKNFNIETIKENEI